MGSSLRRKWREFRLVLCSFDIWVFERVSYSEKWATPTEFMMPAIFTFSSDWCFSCILLIIYCASPSILFFSISCSAKSICVVIVPSTSSLTLSNFWLFLPKAITLNYLFLSCLTNYNPIPSVEPATITYWFGGILLRKVLGVK